MLMRLFLCCVCVLGFGQGALSAEHAIGLSLDSAVLMGDLDTTSDLGYTAALSYELRLVPVFGLGIRAGYEYAEGEARIVDATSDFNGAHEYSVDMIPFGIFALLADKLIPS